MTKEPDTPVCMCVCVLQEGVPKQAAHKEASCREMAGNGTPHGGIPAVQAYCPALGRAEHRKK